MNEEEYKIYDADNRSIDNILSTHECVEAISLIVPQLIKQIAQTNLGSYNVHELLMKSFVTVSESVLSLRREIGEKEIKISVEQALLLASHVSKNIVDIREKDNNPDSLVLFLNFLLKSLMVTVLMHDAGNRDNRTPLLTDLFLNSMYHLCEEFDIDITHFYKEMGKKLPTFITDIKKGEEKDEK
jgi:hypothetical protein